MRFSACISTIVIVATTWINSLACAEEFFWIVDEQILYRIDVDGLEATLVGNLGVEGSDFGGLAYDPNKDILYGLLERQQDSLLVEIDRLTGSAMPIGNPTAESSPDEFFYGFDISPTGEATARTITTSPEVTSVALYSIDLSNGNATKRVESADSFGETDLAYGPDGQLFDVTQSPDGIFLRSIDDRTGAAATVSKMSISDIEHDVALGFNPDDQMLYYLSHPNGLYRVSPATGDTKHLIGFSGLPSEEDEYIGTFAPMPVPEPTSGAWIGLVMVLLKRRSQPRCCHIR